MSEPMVNGGWRVPFLVAFVLGAVAVLLRSRVTESPSFEAAQEKTAEQAADPIFVRHNLLRRGRARAQLLKRPARAPIPCDT